MSYFLSGQINLDPLHVQHKIRQTNFAVYLEQNNKVRDIPRFRKRVDFIDFKQEKIKEIKNYPEYSLHSILFYSIMTCLKPLKIPNLHPSGNPVSTQLNAVRIVCAGGSSYCQRPYVLMTENPSQKSLIIVPVLIDHNLPLYF